MIGPVLLRFWYAPVILALLAALFLTRSTLADCKADRAQVEAKLSVSNASIDALEQAVAKHQAEQMALAAGDAQRLAESRHALGLVEAADKARMAARDRLLASAEIIDPKAACEPSDALKELWP